MTMRMHKIRDLLDELKLMVNEQKQNGTKISSKKFIYSQEHFSGERKKKMNKRRAFMRFSIHTPSVPVHATHSPNPIEELQI